MYNTTSGRLASVHLPHPDTPLGDSRCDIKFKEDFHPDVLPSRVLTPHIVPEEVSDPKQQ